MADRRDFLRTMTLAGVGSAAYSWIAPDRESEGLHVSIRPDSPHYKAWAYKLDPFLNGKRLERCFEADTVTGRAWVYETDADGILRLRNGRLPEKMVRGQITLWMDGRQIA